MKLTKDCKFEYLPERMLRDHIYSGRCAVVKDTVWHCFGYSHTKFCQSWSDNGIRQSSTTVDKNASCNCMVKSILNSVSDLGDSNQHHYFGTLSIYENRPFAFSCKMHSNYLERMKYRKLIITLSNWNCITHPIFSTNLLYFIHSWTLSNWLNYVFIASDNTNKVELFDFKTNKWESKPELSYPFNGGKGWATSSNLLSDWA